jgi:hypothetical protein
MQVHPYRLSAQVRNQVFDQPKNLFIERERFEVAADEPSDDSSIRPQSDLLTRSWLSAKDQPKIAQPKQTLPEQSESRHSEISGGYVERPRRVRAQQCAKHIGHKLSLIIDNVRDAHVCASYFGSGTPQVSADFTREKIVDFMVPRDG